MSKGKHQTAARLAASTGERVVYVEAEKKYLVGLLFQATYCSNKREVREYAKKLRADREEGSK